MKKNRHDMRRVPDKELIRLGIYCEEMNRSFDKEAADVQKWQLIHTRMAILNAAIMLVGMLILIVVI
jgi:hypothetical protein